jgi:hypothetical protein
MRADCDTTPVTTAIYAAAAPGNEATDPDQNCPSDRRTRSAVRSRETVAAADLHRILNDDLADTIEHQRRY